MVIEENVTQKIWNWLYKTLNPTRRDLVFMFYGVTLAMIIAYGAYKWRINEFINVGGMYMNDQRYAIIPIEPVLPLNKVEGEKR